jgi:hypothetical protein
VDDFQQELLEEDEVIQIYVKNLRHLEELVKQYDPLAVAGVMMTQAMSIYRTALSEEDYEVIVDEICKRKDQVKYFTDSELGPTTLQ